MQLQYTYDEATAELVLAHRAAVPDIHFHGGFMLPRVAGGEAATVVPQPIRRDDDVLELAISPTDDIAGGTIRLEKRDGHFVVSTVYRAARDHRLATWILARPGSKLRWNYLANFRNRHHYYLPYKQVSMDGENDGYFGAPGAADAQWEFTASGYRGTRPSAENTYSHDWQFAPHPTSFIFQAPRCNLLAACLDLPQGFGMYLDIEHYTVARWAIDLGGDQHGQWVKAGEEVRSPQFVFALDPQEDVYATARLYHDLLVQWGYIPDPATLPTSLDWRRPFICTWLDQGAIAEHVVQYHEKGEALLNAQTALTTSLIDREIAQLRRTGTPFGIFCIDDGWAICRGDWEMDPVRMHGIRERIDALHELGMKVILWWAPFDIYPEAAMRRRTEWLSGGGQLNRHGMPLIDYSHPRVQEEYLKPMARRWFSDAQDCYNADGIKTDFMADKIHPDMPIYDASWRGEERFIFNTLKLFIEEGRRYKPDFVHQACVAHPYFEELTSVNRCYDNASDDYRIMFERARMQEAFQPGNYVHTTETGDVTRLDLVYELEEALRTGRSIEFTGVLTFGVKEVTEAEWVMIDRHVREFNARWCTDSVVSKSGDHQ
ncbi:MAG TPA: hypothetical protein VGM23_13010 [Armatimonadota bacterium]